MIPPTQGTPPGRPPQPRPSIPGAPTSLGTRRPRRPPDGSGFGFLRLAKLVAALMAVVTCLLGLLTAYAALTLPSASGLGQATGTVRFLDRHGTLIAEEGTSQGGPHTVVKLNQVSAVMQQSIVAAEDRSFYDEGAFNVKRVLHALFIDFIAGRAEQGASTITQQLAKRAFLLDDGSALRKLREALLANQIDQHHTKQQILEMYLNIVYFGHGATGIEDAAITYFGKHASALDLRESSLIAGLAQAPSAYDPFENPHAAFVRQHYVLGQMVDNGEVAAATAAAIDPLAAGSNRDTDQVQRQHQQLTLDDLRNGHPVARPPVLAPHFVTYARNQLEQLLTDNSNVFQGALTVTTTLDLTVQSQAERAVQDGVAALAGRRVNNAATLMLDARGGDILAMVGSAGFNNAAIDGQFNVTTASRRPGSTFKPLVYAAAFESGVLTPQSTLDDTRAMSRRLGGTTDFDNRFIGRLPASRALLLSRNVPAEQAMLTAGVPAAINFAHNLGISTDLAANVSTAIGSSSVRMTDLAQAYTAFAQGGTRAQPRAILRVVDGSGTTILDVAGSPSNQAVMSTGTAADINGILRNYPRTWGLPFRHPTAGKSGTTDNFVDAWYVAYTPDWVLTTWAGHTDAASPGEVGLDGVFGTDVARAISVPLVNSLTGVPFGDFTPAGDAQPCAADCGPSATPAPADPGRANGDGKGTGEGKGNGDGGGG